ncbi:hypothetical protein Tco_1045852 [Tanacetum coccineum]|uniref:Uncharacterized protein n=1 Tax=Tanacetum coccineum TaxID=301880 RepID=A0ABQ5GU09_9ASTR
MWIIASRNGKFIWIRLKIEISRSSSSSFFCFFTLDGKGRFDDLEGWYKMDGRGTGSSLCVVLGSAPSGPSFLVAPLVLAGVVSKGVRKGRSRVLTPDLVVMVKIGASGYHRSGKTLEENDHHICLPRTSIPARPGWSARIHQPHGIFCSSHKLVGDILSNHYAAFPLREKWKKYSLDVSLVASLAWVGGLAPVLLEEDASSSKRFLLAIARDSFCCRCQEILLSLRILFRISALATLLGTNPESPLLLVFQDSDFRSRTVGNHTEVYQVFEDMLKNFDRDDLIKLWSLVQERYNSSRLTEDKEIELWVELKMLFEPNVENLLELQKYMHNPLKWWLYDMCAVHHVSTEKGQDIFMLVEKDYPLTKGLATLMLSNKLRVDQQSEMADELLTKIYNIANKSRK